MAKRHGKRWRFGSRLVETPEICRQGPEITSVIKTIASEAGTLREDVETILNAVESSRWSDSPLLDGAPQCNFLALFLDCFEDCKLCNSRIESRLQ